MNGVERAAEDAGRDGWGHGALCFDKLSHLFNTVVNGFLEIVVDDDAVELGCERQFVFRLLDAVEDDLGFVGTASFEPLAQYVDRRRLDEDEQGAVAIYFLHVDGSLHVDVEHHVLAVFQTLLDFAAQGAVIFVVVDFFKLEEGSLNDFLPELVEGEEVVLSSVLLLTAGLAAGGTDGEVKVLDTFHEAVDDGRLASAARG